MASNELKRDYTLSDGQLATMVSNFCLLLERDLADFQPFGLTQAKIDALKAKGDVFEMLPQDEYSLGLQITATEQKNSLREQVLTTISQLAWRVETKWGSNSNELGNLSISGIYNQPEDSIVRIARHVYTMMTLYLPDLGDFGLTQAALDDFKDLVDSFEVSINSQFMATKNRDLDAQNRIIKGNEIYKELVNYCSLGRKIYAKTNPAKFNDYIIYQDETPGTLTAPTNLVFNYSSKVLWWDVVDNATSYQLQWWNGTDFEELYAGSDINFGFTPPDGLNKFRVRAHNAGGYGPWSDELQQYYFAVLPKAANLQVVQSGTIPTEGELTWNAVPTAVSYKIYQSVDNLGEYAAHWLVIGTVTEPLKSVTLTLGKRNSFRVETNNTYQTSMSDVVFTEV